MVCGEEMRLVQTVPDETMVVPGFEHHILNCPYCHDEERRLVFIHPPEALSAPIEPEEVRRDFLEATLQPLGETTAADGAPQEPGSITSARTTVIESPPLASPPHQSSKSRSARAANSRIWGRKAALHRARWKALCDRLGLRVGDEKVDVTREE
jgi:hypothetical protein